MCPEAHVQRLDGEPGLVMKSAPQRGQRNDTLAMSSHLETVTRPLVTRCSFITFDDDQKPPDHRKTMIGNPCGFAGGHDTSAQRRNARDTAGPGSRPRPCCCLPSRTRVPSQDAVVRHNSPRRRRFVTLHRARASPGIKVKGRHRAPYAGAPRCLAATPAPGARRSTRGTWRRYALPHTASGPTESRAWR